MQSAQLKDEGGKRGVNKNKTNCLYYAHGGNLLKTRRRGYTGTRSKQFSYDIIKVLWQQKRGALLAC